MKLTDRVREWESLGSSEDFQGHSIHVHRQVGDGSTPDAPPLLFLHGFPSSSYDWKTLLAELPGRDVLAFDFLGFGLSDKPRDHLYTLSWQADLAEELVRRHLPDQPVFVLAHDMGTSVATELFAREIEGRTPFATTGALLFNGSMVTERATLTRSQNALLSRLGPVASRLSNRRLFGSEFGAVFSPSHPLSEQEADDQWSLICHNGGRTIGHRLIHYVTERRRYHARWHGAISNWPGRLSLAWGELDPVATTSVLDAVIDLRPGVPVKRLPDLGHYPQIENPAAIASAIATAEALTGASGA
jgi:pimeloyl-ACP methyl ester carboxylesterase